MFVVHGNVEFHNNDNDNDNERSLDCKCYVKKEILNPKKISKQPWAKKILEIYCNLYFFFWQQGKLHQINSSLFSSTTNQLNGVHEIAELAEKW